MITFSNSKSPASIFMWASPFHLLSELVSITPQNVLEFDNPNPRGGGGGELTELLRYGNTLSKFAHNGNPKRGAVPPKGLLALKLSSPDIAPILLLLPTKF